MKKPNVWKMIYSVFALCAVMTARAQTFATLATFDGSNGANPLYESLVQGRDGNFYGTTENGGVNGLGTFFGISSSGILTTLYNFDSAAAAPAAGVVLGSDGNFHGTTSVGGQGNGTLYKITPGGVITVLHVFGGEDGVAPVSPLMQADDGNFYGTTYRGGNLHNGQCAFNGCGTIFKISPQGTFTLLYAFITDPTGHPRSGLVQGTDGALYGTASGFDYGPGAVFRITTAGMFSILYSFCSKPNCRDGDYPSAGLVLANDGNFYGATENGGSNGSGTVFKITRRGNLKTIYNFSSAPNCSDGGNPAASVVQATDGHLYGTGLVNSTQSGNGVLFAVTGYGAEMPLYDFCLQPGCPDGTGLWGAFCKRRMESFMASHIRAEFLTMTGQSTASIWASPLSWLLSEPWARSVKLAAFWVKGSPEPPA